MSQMQGAHCATLRIYAAQIDASLQARNSSIVPVMTVSKITLHHQYFRRWPEEQLTRLERQRAEVGSGRQDTH